MEETKTEETEGTAVEIKDPKAVLSALDRAKADAKKYREAAEALEAHKAELEKKIADLEGDSGIAKYKGRIVELLAKKELAGADVKDVDRIYGLMDTTKFDLDDEGKLTGFKEHLGELKTRLPEVFDKKTRVAGGADGHAAGNVKQEMSTTERQVARLQHKN